MPYSLSFRKSVAIAGREEYINDCCIGGDVVLEHLRKSMEAAYPSFEPTQEDWGWFVWIDRDKQRLAIDVFTHDAEAGAFEIHLTSSRRRFLRPMQVVDTPELELLRAAVVAALEAWPVVGLEVERLDAKHGPVIRDASP